MALEFEEIVTGLVEQEVRSVVLSAQGSVFCAGADIADLEKGGRAINLFIDVLTGCPLHWTAVVRQPVLGAGLALLAVCPVVLITNGATFALPEITRGFFPGALIDGLSDALGARVAYDLAFSGTVLGATQAVTAGLATRVCGEDEIDQIALEGASTLASRHPAAVNEGIDRWQRRARRIHLP